MKEGIPVNRVFLLQPVVERIGIGENLRIQQLVEAQRSLPASEG
jgi:hypothetical protein